MFRQLAAVFCAVLLIHVLLAVYDKKIILEAYESSKDYAEQIEILESEIMYLRSTYDLVMKSYMQIKEKSTKESLLMEEKMSEIDVLDDKMSDFMRTLSSKITAIEEKLNTSEARHKGYYTRLMDMFRVYVFKGELPPIYQSSVDEEEEG
jgi:hypothetical protein